MCGIVGFTGHHAAAPILLEGLSKLEYRGYDSAGLAVRDGTNPVRIVKAKGRLRALAEKTDNGLALPGTSGIGHTRWATHGDPSDVNSHPHSTPRVSIVHNGIIENYGLLKERSGALYDLLDALDTAQYSDVDESTDAYLLAQNKLWITTGDTASFADQIALLAQQAQTVQAQLGNPTQIAAPTTGYFVRAASSGRLNAGAADILAQSPEQLKAYLDSDPEMPLDGCVGKLVAGFSWQYAGVCSAKQAEKLLGADGKPLRTAVEISFPGQSDAALRATVSEVTIDAEKDVARFVLQCNSINGDVLCLNHARARISTGESTGLRVPAAAVHYLKEDGTEAETQGENYIPGVYVKYGNIARFCKIDPVDADHPLISEDDYILVLPKGTDGSVSQVRLYDEIIVSGQNLYDGKLL